MRQAKMRQRYRLRMMKGYDARLRKVYRIVTAAVLAVRLEFLRHRRARSV